MTEKEWKVCTDPQAMVTFLHAKGTLSERKARLFSVACCRRIWPLLTDERSRAAVEAAEAYADGGIDKDALKGAWDAEGVTATGHAIDGATASDALWGAGWSSMNAAEGKGEAVRHRAEPDRLLSGLSPRDGLEVEAQLKEIHRALQAERTEQCAIFRDIVGNPFRLVEVDPAWQTPTILALARSTYETRTPEGTLDRGLVLTLGECLADAGCDDAELLEHLREPGPHWRGCHALDLILGKH